MEIKFVGDMQRLVVQPGDKFVLKVPHVISQETAKAIQDEWLNFAGPNVKLLILPPEAELGVISGVNAKEAE